MSTQYSFTQVNDTPVTVQYTTITHPVADIMIARAQAWPGYVSHEDTDLGLVRQVQFVITGTLDDFVAAVNYE
jgi:hypothetical protein